MSVTKIKINQMYFEVLPCASRDGDYWESINNKTWEPETFEFMKNYINPNKDYIELGLNGEEPLKLILCGSVESKDNNKIGVVAVVYATTDKNLAEQKMQELLGDTNNSDKYYMVYSVPLNTDLTTLEHYPSIEITKNDLLEL